MRKCAIPLTDSFFFTDHILNSPLGRYVSLYGATDDQFTTVCSRRFSCLVTQDGDVYNAYYDTVRRANPPVPHPYFERVIKPLLEAPAVDLKGRL